MNKLKTYKELLEITKKEIQVKLKSYDDKTSFKEGIAHIVEIQAENNLPFMISDSAPSGKTMKKLYSKIYFVIEDTKSKKYVKATAKKGLIVYPEYEVDNHKHALEITKKLIKGYEKNSGFKYIVK